MVKSRYDIAVVGGGMVGASCALAAAQQGLQVLLVERERPLAEWSAESFDLRVSALTRTSQQLLDQLGAWPLMAGQRITPYRDMCVWEREVLGEVTFHAADLGEPDLGHIVENRVITHALWRLIEQAAHIDVCLGKEIVGLEHSDQASTLVFTDGQHIQARVIVGADGAKSQVRELAGIPCHMQDYQQRAVVATVETQQGNVGTAWQRFMPTGPLALLPVTQHFFSIVWSTTPTQAETLLQMSAADFNQALTEASQKRCGNLTLRGKRVAFPLRKQTAAAYIKPGVALLGDAAHVIHPLAGQGVNLGFLDVGALIDVLHHARMHHEPLGRLGVLRRYERARKGYNQTVQMAMDGFKQLFGNTNPALYALRNLGLGLTGRIPVLRQQFERMALGQGVELPDFLKR